MNQLEVRTPDEAQRLNDWLLSYTEPVGLDCETLGWTPSQKVSPVARARVWCLTLAWADTTVFVPRALLMHLRPWLESTVPQKVGTNLLGFDRHVLSNEGVDLDGLLADTVVMSRLLDSRPELDDGAGHSLDAWGERVGVPKAGSFQELVTVTILRTIPGKVKTYKDARRQGVLYGGEAQEVKFKLVTEEWDLARIWEQLPQRREAIQRYACADPQVSLRVYSHLRQKLEGRRW
jgi:hypothetical protein